jgi:sulfur-oxidizing protein SoxY
MHVGRRFFLSSSIGFAALAALPRALLAAAWPEKVFASTAAGEAMISLLGTDQTIPTDQITLKVPEIAENGAVVPVTVKTKMANVTNISIFADKNPQPLAASFTLPEGTAAEVSIRIRLGETQVVKAVIEADGKLYTKEQEVKVTIGGCGG